MAEPLKIVEDSDREISIEWSDATETRYTAAGLRRLCPCAACIDEWTGEKRLNENSIPEDTAFRHISIVGRYALNFHFSDGHETGIYSFAYLKGIA